MAEQQQEGFLFLRTTIRNIWEEIFAEYHTALSTRPLFLLAYVRACVVASLFQILTIALLPPPPPPPPFRL